MRPDARTLRNSRCGIGWYRVSVGRLWIRGLGFDSGRVFARARGGTGIDLRSLLQARCAAETAAWLCDPLRRQVCTWRFCEDVLKTATAENFNGDGTYTAQW
jgi:hypothetical protein